MVEAVRDEDDAFVGDVIEGHLLWKQLASDAVHVFVRRSWPLP